MSRLRNGHKYKKGKHDMTLIVLTLVAICIYYLFVMKGHKGIVGNKTKVCPNCRSTIEDGFNVCPVCKETLKRKCVNCGEWLNVQWIYCPYCELSQGKNTANEE